MCSNVPYQERSVFRNAYGRRNDAAFAIMTIPNTFNACPVLGMSQMLSHSIRIVPNATHGNISNGLISDIHTHDESAKALAGNSTISAIIMIHILNADLLFSILKTPYQ